MTIAIARKNGDMLWFDAVLNFNRQFSGAVTKHPLEDGSIITDHTTIENEVISLSGVLSDADFNLNRPIIGTQDAGLYGLQNKQFVNNTPVTSNRVGPQIYENIIISEAASGLTKFLPESAGQFFKTDAPTVSLNPATITEKTRPAEFVQAALIAMFEGREEFTLIDFNIVALGQGSSIRQIFDRCVFTGLSFAEDADSGDAVYPVMTIERVRYAFSTTTQIQKKTSPDVASKVSQKRNEGAQTASKTAAGDLNPQRKTGYTDREAFGRGAGTGQIGVSQ